jgi:hypothetical protein
MSMMNWTSRLYARYAVALLAVTLLAGVYLRAVFTFPGVRPGFGVTGPNLVHAHSHAGFFGWAAMAAFAVMTLQLRPGARARVLHAGLAHALGVGSVAAFVGFALRGYDMVTIPLSALHVLLWLTFAVAVWRPLGEVAEAQRRYLRASLVFLVVAGAATVAPVLVMVRGITEPWLYQITVKLFLTPFVSGFLLLAALSVFAARMEARRATASLLLIAAGVLPSTFLYVAAPPPLPGLLLVGRAGMALLGAGLLLFSLAAWRPVARDVATRPLAFVALLAVLSVGVLKLLAALGVGAAFMHNRNLTIAVLHVVLLGIVTPAFVLALKPTVRARRRVAIYGAGLLVMVGALAVTAWPWAARTVMAAGVSFNALYLLVFAGGAVAAAALLSVLLPTAGSRSAPAAVQPRRREASVPLR